MEGARADAAEVRAGKRGGTKAQRRVAEEREDYATMSPDKQAAKLKELEDAMYRHARDLEFEDAARVRDQLQRLREVL